MRRLVPWIVLLGLVAATLLVWQWRFVAVPHRINGNAGFGAGLQGWTTTGGSGGAALEQGHKVVRFARQPTDGELVTATRWFGSLGELRFLHVAVDARWSGIAAGNAIWAVPRLVLLTKDKRGRIGYPWDHAAFLATGERGWHREEAVFELTPDMEDVGLAFQMLGRSGRMDIRNLTVTAVHGRRWVPVATALVVAGWILWITRRLRATVAPTAWWRAAAGAAIVTAASWYLVFPGPRMQSRPMVGSFLIGSAEDPAPTAAGKPPAASPAAGTEPRTPPGGGPPRAEAEPHSAAAHPQPAARTAPTAPAGEARTTPIITDLLRQLDGKLDLVHLVAFFALGTAVFVTTGRLAAWRLLAAVALLSELVPIWHDGWVDAGDVLDLATDLGGIALAAGVFALLRTMARRFRPAVPAG